MGSQKSHIPVLEYQLKRSATSNPCQCSSAQPPNFSRRHAAESSSALPSTKMPTLLHQGHDCDPSEVHSHTHEPNFLMSNDCICDQAFNIRVFHKNTFFKKKNRAYPHVSLWGIYNTDPKAFFVWTSLRGLTS